MKKSIKNLENKEIKNVTAIKGGGNGFGTRKAANIGQQQQIALL